MTPWERVRDRAQEASPRSRRRWLVVGVATLAAIAVVITVGPWVVWPFVVAGMWLLLIGAVVFVAVRLAQRGQ